MAIRILLLADTHLGFDLPQRPRVARRRRGPDFFDNYERALAPALAGEVDLVVHGGDLLYRNRVRRQLVLDAFEPLKRVADAGVPVLLVPGNHERSSIPFPLLAAHPDLHILSHPMTVTLQIRGTRVVLAGFPSVRNGVAAAFGGLVEETGHRAQPGDVKLLCIHQTVEGARVGPVGYTFRTGDDVIAGSDVPGGFAAVLAGHIHRAQVLERDLLGRPLAAPVLYPGSIERTSFAERHEPKGYMLLEVAGSPDGGELVKWGFCELPARPMFDLELDFDTVGDSSPVSWAEWRLRELPDDAVVRLRLSSSGESSGERSYLAALRETAPPTMTLEVRVGGRRERRSPRQAPAGAGRP